jgi:hypothetical protein
LRDGRHALAFLDYDLITPLRITASGIEPDGPSPPSARHDRKQLMLAVGCS